MNTAAASMPDSRPGLGRLCWQSLSLPWLAHDHGQRLFMAAMLILALVLTLVLMTLLSSDPIASVAIVGAVVDFVLWVYFLPGCLLLMYSARGLHTPGVQRAIIRSLLVYLVLKWLVPALVIGWVASHPLLLALGLLLGCAGMFLFAMLPAWLAMVLLFTPATLTSLSQFVDLSLMTLPDPGDPGCILTWGLLAGATVVLAVARWQQLCSRPMPASRLRRPTIYSLLKAISAGGGRNAELTLIRQRPGWLEPAANLKHTGPGHFGRSLRVALGGPWLPVTARTKWRSWALGVGVFTLSISFLAMVVHDDSHLRGQLTHLIFLVGGSGGAVGRVRQPCPASPPTCPALLGPGQWRAVAIGPAPTLGLRRAHQTRRITHMPEPPITGAGWSRPLGVAGDQLEPAWCRFADHTGTG